MPTATANAVAEPVTGSPKRPSVSPEPLFGFALTLGPGLRLAFLLVVGGTLVVGSVVVLLGPVAVVGAVLLVGLVGWVLVLGVDSGAVTVTVAVPLVESPLSLMTVMASLNLPAAA